MSEKPNYGNWVSARLILAPGVLGIALGILSFFIPLLFILALILIVCSVYFAYARYQFSSRGGDVQTKIQELVFDYLKWDGDGEALDIGCGNGPLTLCLAKKYSTAKATGIDYWGSSWEYSIKVCEKNAQIEKVSKRVFFQQASAAKLPFEDGAFDAVISNLTFHEVRDVKDKQELVREALRVVKKGGKFAFQDLFLWKAVYGSVDDLLTAIKSWGIEQVEFVDTSGSKFIPGALKLPFMVGTIGIIYGQK